MSLIISRQKPIFSIIGFTARSIHFASDQHHKVIQNRSFHDFRLHMIEYKILGAFYVQKEKHAHLMDQHGILRRDEIQLDLVTYLAQYRKKQLNDPCTLTYNKSAYVIYNERTQVIELYDIATKTLKNQFPLPIKENESIHMISFSGSIEQPVMNPDFLLFEIRTYSDPPVEIMGNAFWALNLLTGQTRKITTYFDRQKEEIAREKAEKLAKLEAQVNELEAQDPETKIEDSERLQEEITVLKNQINAHYPNSDYYDLLFSLEKGLRFLMAIDNDVTQKNISPLLDLLVTHNIRLETSLKNPSTVSTLNPNEIILNLIEELELVLSVKKALLKLSSNDPRLLEDLDNHTDEIRKCHHELFTSISELICRLKNLEKEIITPRAQKRIALKSQINELKEHFGTNLQYPSFNRATYPCDLDKTSNEVIFFHKVYVLDEKLKNQTTDGHTYVCSYNLVTEQIKILKTFTEDFTKILLDERGEISTLIIEHQDLFAAYRLDEKGNPELKFYIPPEEKNRLSAKVYTEDQLILFDNRFTDKKVPLLKSLKDNSEKHLLSQEEEIKLKSDVIDAIIDPRTDQLKGHITYYDQEEIHLKSPTGQVKSFKLRSFSNPEIYKEFLEICYSDRAMNNPLQLSFKTSEKETKNFILTKESESQKLRIEHLLTQEHPLPFSPITKGKLSKKTKSFTFKARDGLSIQAYITFPQHVKKYENLPTILLIHGGPQHRDKVNDDRYVLFWASRGFAVVRINFRGSEGFGKAFLKSAWGDWHGRMTDDLIDGLDFLKSKKIIDSSRIVALGHSYGAFAVSSLLTKYPDYFQCGIAENGTYNLVEDFQAIVEQKTIHPIELEIRQFGANPLIHEETDTAEAKLKMQSPFNFIQNMTKPLLLITGSADDNCLPSQSADFAREAKKWGKSVTHIEFKGDKHIFTLAHEPHLMGIEENFVARYVPGIYAEPMDREIKQNPVIQVKTTSQY